MDDFLPGFCYTWAIMEKSIDIQKALSQHAALNSYFADFIPKGKIKGPQPPPPPVQQMPSESPQAPAGTDLNGLHQQILTCEQCGLHQSRTHAVPGEGSHQAQIMFVGEAPGGDEDRTGHPFVGRAGQLLDNILSACGLNREEVFIGNILKCRPPHNRDPQEQEIHQCLPYLHQQIALIQPQIIVALGAHAARTLLQCDDSIGRLRGRFHRLPNSDPAIQVMPTYHPAYLLRNYTQETRGRVWEDMKNVMKAVGRPVG